jgi:hypothetical protein
MRYGFSRRFATMPGVSAPSTVSLPGDLTPATISAGSLVDSTYIHHDQPGSPQSNLNGSVIFDTDVLGAIVNAPSLVASNTQLGR